MKVLKSIPAAAAVIISALFFTAGRLSAQSAAPLADHHTHIWSLNAANVTIPPPLAAVTLPEDLTAFLRQREQGWNNKTALLDLYAEDALMLDSRGEKSGWMRGRDQVAEQISGTFGRPYVITPVSYHADGSAGFITGYFARQDGNTLKPFGNVSLALKKASSGKWQIANEILSFPGPLLAQELTAEQLVKEMDVAGVKKSAVLSVAFWFGNPTRQVADEYAKVRAENDWVAKQVARYPDRLVGFCSFNPLKDYALEELGRCTTNPSFKGLKMHLGNSHIEVLQAQDAEKLRVVFRAANEKRFPIIIHLWTSDAYGRADAEAFLNKVLPAAPDIPIQIAHMGATGPGYHSDDAFEVYAAAAEKKDPRMKNVYIDVASDVIRTTPPETLALVAKRLRQFGLQRVLFASDRSPGFGNESPKEAWQSFRQLPLTEEEFKTIANNVAPYMR